MRFLFPPTSWIFGILTALAIWSCPVTTIAQELIRGIVNAKILAPLDRASPTTIRFQKDAEMNDRLALVAIRALKERQFAISRDGPLELIIEIHIEGQTGTRRDVEFRGEGGSSRRSGKSFGVQSRITGDTRKPARPRPQYHVKMTLLRAPGTQIWWGEITAAFNQPNRETAFAFLIETLAHEIGNSVQNKRLETN